MSLKTDYTGNFGSAMEAVFAAGQLFVTTNSATISAELITNANSGNRAFTITILTSFETANLRLEGLHLQTYLAGITSALGAEFIYGYECTPVLNTQDQADTYINMNFDFTYA